VDVASCEINLGQQAWAFPPLFLDFNRKYNRL
jgi:hypothetical protein